MHALNFKIWYFCTVFGYFFIEPASLLTEHDYFTMITSKKSCNRGSCGSFSEKGKEQNCGDFSSYDRFIYFAYINLEHFWSQRLENITTNDITKQHLRWFSKHLCTLVDFQKESMHHISWIGTLVIMAAFANSRFHLLLKHMRWTFRSLMWEAQKLERPLVIQM